MMPKLQAGDVFCVSRKTWIGRAINAVQKILSRDNHSIYSHTGIIRDGNGMTLEALEKITTQHFYNAYKGEQVLIARVRSLDKRRVKEAISKLDAEHLGDIYPYWRLPLQLFPILAKYISYKGRWLVCSELTGKFLHLIGERHRGYKGTTPDTLADEWRNWKNFEIIYEGVIP